MNQFYPPKWKQVMGDRGRHAGGFAYMTRKVCACGRYFIVGRRNEETKCHICREGGDGTPQRLKGKK